MKKYKMHKINLENCSQIKNINIFNVEMILEIKDKGIIKESRLKMRRISSKKYEVKLKKYLRIQKVTYLINNSIRIEAEKCKKKMEEIFNFIEDNKVAVLATMSSGKSTLLNALIGREILPSENQACTGKIFEISNQEGNTEKVKIFKNGHLIDEKILVDCDLKLLNTDEDIVEVKINTKFERINRKISFFDTPGVNNSINLDHHKITYDFLQKNNVKNYIYLLNATQIGVLDDYKFLVDLKEIIEQDKEKYKVVFLLNKIDFIDEEKENLKKLIENVTEYLNKIGFEAPILIPISAYKASILRRGMNGDLRTRAERRAYSDIINEYIERKKIKNYEENKLIKQILKETGIEKLENILK